MKQSNFFPKVMVVLLIAMTMTFSNCVKDQGVINKDITSNLPDTVSFSKQIIPIFNANCSISGCHVGAYPVAQLNLSASMAYDQLFAKSYIDTLNPEFSVIYIEMNSSTTNKMPPTGRLSDYDVGLVLKWIQQKAKNN